jgi:hypothetical protein
MTSRVLEREGHGDEREAGRRPSPYQSSFLRRRECRSCTQATTSGTPLGPHLPASMSHSTSTVIYVHSDYAFLGRPELQLEPTKSSTFPREGSLSQPDKNTESVVDLLDEALEVLDEEEDQRKQRERQGAMKPWKPQHRGRFRLSLQDSSYYDYRLYNSYRHFNRNRAFHGSKQSSSSTHLNVDPSAEMVASAQLQESLVELSQTSDTAIDPHIRSFVFEGAHTEAGGATEL